MRIPSHVKRGLSYFFTSVAVLLVGHLMRNGLINGPDIPVLLISIIPSFFFFMCYAKRFPAELPEREGITETPAKRGSIFPHAVITGLVTLVVFLFARNLQYEFPAPLISILIIQAAFYIYYGIFLWRSEEPAYPPVIRDQLVWSVILSIGISLYFGLTFSSSVPVPVPVGSDPAPGLGFHFDIIPWLSLAPVLFIGVLYLFTKKSEPKRFLIINVMAAFICGFLSFLVKVEKISIPFIPEELIGHFVTMQFCIIVSAYLAVFESWWVTSFISRIEAKNPSLGKNKSSLYSMATMMALTVSVGVLPLFFVYSQYGEVFLVFFGLHSLLAFWCWSRWGRESKLTSIDWGIYKVIAGSLFLLGMVVITRLSFSAPSTGKNHFISNHITWGAIAAYLIASIFLMKNFGRKYRKELGYIRKIFEERVNFTRILGLICFIACAILQIVYDANKGELAYKSDLAFIFYGICIGICLIVEWGNYFRYKPRFSLIMSQLFAFLVLIRTVPSLLIALAVFLPSVYTGRSIGASILSALPFFLSAAGGYALNDFFDVEKDSITKPYRAIPSGKLSPPTVWRFSIVTISLAFLTAVFFYQSATELILYVICILSVMLYNVVVKHISLSKTFLTAAVSSLPLLFSVFAYQYPAVYVFLPIATGSFILGREWLMDVRDLEGDTGRTLTIPMRLGTRPTVILGFVFQFVTVLLLLPIAINFPSYWSISLIIMIGISSALLAKLWTYNAGMFYQRVVQLLWLPMLFGVLLFAK